MEYDRHRDLALAENARANTQGKILVPLDSKTWVYAVPGQPVVYQKRSWKDAEDTTDHKTRFIKVKVDDTIYPNVRLAAAALSMDFSYLYKLLTRMKSKNLNTHTFKGGKTVKLSFVK